MKAMNLWSRRVVPTMAAMLFASSAFLAVMPAMFSGAMGARDQPREVREALKGKQPTLRLKPEGAFVRRKPLTRAVTKRRKRARNVKQ